MPKPEGQSRPPIDDELLAAFIDGRLTGEKRAEVIERLAEDEDAYELYDTVMRVQEELAAEEVPDGPFSEPTEAPVEPKTPGEGPGKARVAPFRPRFGRLAIRWLPVAAALALALLAGWWLLRSSLPSSVDLLASFDPAKVTPEAARSAPERLEKTFRGESEDERASRAARFKLGARAFDLALAAEAGEQEATERWLKEMPELLGEVDFSFGLPEHYQEIAALLAAGEELADLRDPIAAAETVLEEELDVPEAPLFAFGRWLEAVRFAADHGDRSFLASRAARRPLRYFLDSNPSEQVGRHLGTLSEGLGRGAAAADLSTLKKAATDTIEHCATGYPCLGVTPRSVD